MGKKAKVAAGEAQVLKHMWKNSDAPPTNLQDALNQVAHFIDGLGYSQTVNTLQKEASKHNVNIIVTEKTQGDKHVPLLNLYQSSRDPHSSDTSDSSDEESEDDSDDRDPAEGVLVDVEAEETSDDESDENGEDEVPAESSKSGQKRKRVLTPPSSPSSGDSSSSDSSDSDDSSSDADSDSSSDSDAQRPAKRAKVQESDDSSSASDTHSDSDSDASSSKGQSSADENNDSSSSDSDSDSDSGPASASDSTSSESSDPDSDDDSSSSSDAPPPAAKEKSKAKKDKLGKTKQSKVAKPAVASKTPATKTAENHDRSGSTSSSTLDGEPVTAAAAASAGNVHPDRLMQVDATAGKEDLLVPDNVHPDRVKRVPATQENIKELKKQNVPFSRIPSDQRVDPRFSSNAYVPYDYADRAHQDLIVTKGKGFTKEKNKKKRGSYRGGTIDLTPKGIKFDD